MRFAWFFVALMAVCFTCESAFAEEESSPRPVAEDDVQEPSVTSSPVEGPDAGAGEADERLDVEAAPSELPPGDEDAVDPAVLEPLIAEPPVEEDGVDEEDGADIEDFDLGELLRMPVVTAAKTEQTVEEAPAIIDVITYQDISQRGYRTVSDAIRDIPGIYVVDDHVNTHVGVRGVFGSTDSANDVVKIMIDGQPVAFRPTAVSPLGYDLIPVGAIERIEVLRGPASALYGANAFLGVINIITFKGAKTEGEPRADHGVVLDGYHLRNHDADSFNGSVSAYSDTAIGDFQYFLAGVFHRADRSGMSVPGVDDLIRDSLYRGDNTVTPPLGFPSPGWDQDARHYMLGRSMNENDVETAGSLYASAGYQFSPTVSATLDGNGQYSERSAEFLDYTYLTHDSRLTQLNGYLRGRFEYEGEALALSLSIAASAGQPTDDERIVDRLVRGSVKRREFGNLAFDVVAEGSYGFGPLDSIRVGLDYSHDLESLLTMKVINEETGVVTTEAGFGERTFGNFGAFAQWTWNVWDKLTLTLGSRLDHNTVIACNSEEWNCVGALDDETAQGSTATQPDVLIDNRGLFQISNRAALVYEFPFAGLYAKLIYGSSFKPPTPFQLYHRQMAITGSSVGNPSLHPQTADTGEAIVGLRHKGVEASVTGFFTEVADVVIFLKETNLLEGRNADVQVGGIEWRAAFYQSRALSFFTDGSLLLHTNLTPKQRRGESDFAWSNSPFNADAAIERYPNFVVHCGLNYTLTESHLNTFLSIGYVGSRRASLINNQLYNHVDLAKTYELPGYLTTNITLSSVGLFLLSDEDETVVSASLQGSPGGFVESGSGGIDIPSLGPRFYVRLEQQF